MKLKDNLKNLVKFDVSGTNMLIKKEINTFKCTQSSKILGLKDVKIRNSNKLLCVNNKCAVNSSSNLKKFSAESLKKNVLLLKKLQSQNLNNLIFLAKSFLINNLTNYDRYNLISLILKKYIERGFEIIGEGVLEILPDSYGFLRSAKHNYRPCFNDIYISPNQIKKFSLRNGDTLRGLTRPPKQDDGYFIIESITEVNSQLSHISKDRVFFENLIPLYPEEMISLECASNSINNLSGRIVDIVSPLGKGQRALVVAPPKTGKTVLIQNIADIIAINYPDMYLIVLAVGERPEEVTDMLKSIKGEIVSSTFDEPSYRHVQLAEIVIEKAKRLVEYDKDVVILLDSITRLARAYNDISPPSGKVLSGGVDSSALQRPKKFFGAARNIKRGGSLTIIATALVETGSRMDEVIFEEFKGTGNAEIALDRKIADKRIFPAVNILKSSTRKEELLVDNMNLSRFWVMRKTLSSMNPAEAIMFLIKKINCSKNNNEFLRQMNSYGYANNSMDCK